MRKRTADRIAKLEHVILLLTSQDTSKMSRGQFHNLMVKVCTLDALLKDAKRRAA